jgi:hypothetical protein
MYVIESGRASLWGGPFIYSSYIFMHSRWFLSVSLFYEKTFVSALVAFFAAFICPA